MFLDPEVFITTMIERFVHHAIDISLVTVSICKWVACVPTETHKMVSIH